MRGCSSSLRPEEPCGAHPRVPPQRQGRRRDEHAGEPRGDRADRSKHGGNCSRGHKAPIVTLPAESPAREGLTFDELVQAARRTWRSAIVWGAIGLSLAAIAGIVRPKKYTARASFIAEQQRVRSLPTGLGALA